MKNSNSSFSITRTLPQFITALTHRYEWIVDYCSCKVRTLIEFLKNYIQKDWIAFEKDLLKYYNANRHDTRYIIHDLSELTKQWKHQAIKSLTEWKWYEHRFITIAGWLYKKKISDQEQAAYFWWEINKKLRNCIENRLLIRSPPLFVKKPFLMEDVVNVVEQYFEWDWFDYNLADFDSDLSNWIINRDLPESSDSDDESTDSDLKKAARRILRCTKTKKRHNSQIWQA